MGFTRTLNQTVFKWRFAMKELLCSPGVWTIIALVVATLIALYLHLRNHWENRNFIKQFGISPIVKNFTNDEISKINIIVASRLQHLKGEMDLAIKTAEAEKTRTIHPMSNENLKAWMDNCHELSEKQSIAIKNYEQAIKAASDSGYDRMLNSCGFTEEDD